MKKILLLLLFVNCLTNNITAQCSAAFTYYVSNIAPPNIYFMDSSITSTNIMTSYWDFGDGSPVDTDRTAVHNYSTMDTFYVCRTIVDSVGCMNTYCDSITNILPHSIEAFLNVPDSLDWYGCVPHTIFWYMSGNSTGYYNSDSIFINIDFGDGTDTSFYWMIFDPIHGGDAHTYLNPGIYTPTITIITYDSLIATNVSQIVNVASTCDDISGTVYNDLNNNCLVDPGEGLPHIEVSLLNGTHTAGFTYTDSSGQYLFHVPTGISYDIRISTTGGFSYPFAPACPPGGIISVGSFPSTGNDFGVTCPTGYDLKGTVTGWRFRPGITSTICISAYNLSCTTPTGEIEVTLSPNVTPQPDTSGIGYTIVGNTIILQIDSTRRNWSFCVPVLVDVNAQIGDSVCIDLVINPVIGDLNPNDNIYRFCRPIRNAVDPNDKYANPAGIGVEGFIEPNKDLEYTIRFQNTGTDEAWNIFIVDTISPNLDIASLEVIGSSHPISNQMRIDNIVRFNFYQIHLPDSNDNEPASHGYITYRIKQSPTISHLAQITNTAYIYFDYNTAVVTNTTLNTIDQFLSAPVINKNSAVINLYPNPSNQKCLIYFGDNHRKTISITDILGKEVFRNTSSTDSYLLNTEKFENGIYTVRVKDENNKIQTGKLIITH